MKALFLFRERYLKPFRDTGRDFQTDVGSKKYKNLCALWSNDCRVKKYRPPSPDFRSPSFSIRCSLFSRLARHERKWRLDYDNLLLSLKNDTSMLGFYQVYVIRNTSNFQKNWRFALEKGDFSLP